MRSRKAKNLIGFAAGILWFELAISPTEAAFSSIHIFGDSVSTTTNNASPYPSATNYFGRRFSNGRVWVEVLAQRQGLPNNTITNADWSFSSNNWSYWGNYSSNVVKSLTNFPAPPEASNALFVVWVCDADIVYDVSNYSTNLAQWTSAINLSLTNHFKIITNLYAKGARTLIMPNAVDISAVPLYRNYPAATNGFLRQRVMDFNTAFTVVLNSAMVLYPELKIYEPDFFGLLDQMLTNAAAFGLTNAGTYALNQNPPYLFKNLSMTGPGANFIWWDNQDPTAKAHAVMADVAQQLISPVQITNITVLEDDCHLGVASLPIGLDGFVDGCTSLSPWNWIAVANVASTNATQTISLPASGPLWFYRLRFPYAWSWP